MRNSLGGMWEVSGTDKFAEWFSQLDEDEQAAVEQRIDLLADQGPALKRPVVGEISTSKYRNMKELRASVGSAKLLVHVRSKPRGDLAARWR
jgi:hypothetical protein